MEKVLRNWKLTLFSTPFGRTNLLQQPDLLKVPRFFPHHCPLSLVFVVARIVIRLKLHSTLISFRIDGKDVVCQFRAPPQLVRPRNNAARLLFWETRKKKKKGKNIVYRKKSTSVFEKNVSYLFLSIIYYPSLQIINNNSLQ